MLKLKEKDVIQKISTAIGPIKVYEESISYRINKIVGTDVWYNKFINADLMEADVKGTLADLQDDTKYKLSTKAFPIATIVRDMGTGELKTTYKYNTASEAEADLKHKHFEFNPKMSNGVVMITKSELATEIKK